MRRFRVVCSVLLLSFTAWVSAFAQGSYKAVAIKGLPPAGNGVTPAILSLLEPQGAKFEDSQGKTAAEMWFSKAIAAPASPSTESDVIYHSLTPGIVIGLLDAVQPITDYRNQHVQPGIYTMRYELVPEDGNHMGVSDYRDFVLLIPASFDTDPSATLSFKAVVQLSRKAVNTGHPAVLCMDPAKSGAAPQAFLDDNQDWALEADGGLKAASGDKPFPMAVVLVGVSSAVQE